MPIEIAITRTGAPGRAIDIAQLRESHQVFTFPSDVEPAGVSLDPDAGVMRQATFEKK